MRGIFHNNECDGGLDLVIFVLDEGYRQQNRLHLNPYNHANSTLIIEPDGDVIIDYNGGRGIWVSLDRLFFFLTPE